MSRWIFEPGHTEVEFCARHMMVAWVRGLFKDIHGDLEFDINNPLGLTFQGEIDATKLWTGEPTRDGHLRSADFFDVENYPTIFFEGKFVEQIGPVDFKALSQLTVRGNTNEVPLDVTYLGEWTTPYWEGDENKGDIRRIGFTAKTVVDRHKFGVSWQDKLPNGGVLVSNEIPLTLDAEAMLEEDLVKTGAIKNYHESA